MDHMATKASRGRKPKDEGKGESMRVRVSAEEKEAWTEAAKKVGRNLSGWLRYLANREAGRAET